MSKPIKVFFSPLSQRFFASRAYKEVQPGVFDVTGEKFDVTDDIAGIIVQNGITFSESPKTEEPH